MRDKELTEFFLVMYENFGQWSVINFIKDRQENGQLKEVSWNECLGCEEYSPILRNSCVVCGERQAI